jgi:hypothetical protein
MSSGQGWFWDVQDRLRELSAQGDPLGSGPINCLMRRGEV